MRHFLSYDANGKLIGVHTYVDSPSQLGGFPADFDLENDSTENERVIAWKNGMKNKDIVGYVLYDCPCSPTVKVCECPSQHRVSHYLNDSMELTPRPATGILIDGGPYTDSEIISHPPGTVLALKVACAGAPDGSKVILGQYSSIQVLDTTENSVELTITAGETPPVNVTAPAQGMCGELFISGDHVLPMRFRLRGWGT